MKLKNLPSIHCDLEPEVDPDIQTSPDTPTIVRRCKTVCHHSPVVRRYHQYQRSLDRYVDRLYRHFIQGGPIEEPIQGPLDASIGPSIELTRRMNHRIRRRQDRPIRMEIIPQYKNGWYFVGYILPR